MVQRGPQRVCGFLAFFLFCAALKASPLVELQLDAPAGCPSKDSIEQTLARLVQRPPTTPLRVNARLVPDAERWVLVAMLEGGQRVVGGDTCVAVAEALVVIVALAIDPTSMNASALEDFEHANAANARPTQPPTAAIVSAAPPTPPAPPIAVAPSGGGGWRVYEAQAQAHASAPPWHPHEPDRLGMSVLLLGEVGSLPAASFGPSLWVRYGSPLRWGELSANGLYPRLKYENGSNSKGARFGLATLQLGGCVAPGYGWPVAGCVGAEIGDLIGRGVNTDTKVTQNTTWAAFTAGLVYRGKLRGDFGLELRLFAAVPLVRRDFDVQNSSLTFTPGTVALRGLVGASWR